ncbi:MAG: U32 family peptidase, partial [Spirochaetales bacterium]|nr:U32 family peptidase [Spirochaetales bacterium]
MSELLAPAGSFDSGFYALHSGADALYLGLSSFSARKAAKNFTYDEFSRIKALAETQGKKVYAALNTVIRDDELEAVTGLLFDLAALNVDGIIVQDFGLLAILTQFFPSIAPHASTQMAVHNAQGAQALLRAGARRLILARELTLEEITTIRRRVPEAELEVFIHGALCYSFSGLCLASGLLLRRSGNRGECAQLCRSCYKDSSGDAGYFFSRPDLAAEERVLRLRDMGIALKIEGRMKPPAWVAAVTAYYRALLDGKPRAELEELLEKSRLIFSRASGPGFLDGSGGGQTSPLYPGHTGIFAGRTAEESRNSEFGRTPAFFRLREKTHGRALRGFGTAASRQYTLRVPSNPLRVGEQQFCSRKIATSP